MYLYGAIVLVACAVSEEAMTGCESLLIVLISCLTASTAQLVIPPWPFYNQHKTQWLPNRPESSTEEVEGTDAAASTAVIDAGAEGSKKKRSS